MHSLFKIAVGLIMLISSIGLDYLGSSIQSLTILVFSMIFTIAGAFVGIRGLIEFLGERFRN